MTTTELVPAPRPGVLLPVEPEQVSAAMQAYVATVKAALAPSDWQGTPDQPGSFIKKSGWQKIAKAYTLSRTVVSETVDRDEEGAPLRAAAVMRVTGPNGQAVEATGYCSRTESRFASVSGRQKIEHDLRATAMTRAENRAISNLVGVGAVSAEEADGGVVDAEVVRETVPEWAKAIGPGEDFGVVLGKLADVAYPSGDPAGAEFALRLGNATYRECDGGIPACVNRFARRLLFLYTTPTDPAPAEGTAR